MEVGRVQRIDWEIRLSWKLLSYWIPREQAPMGKFSTKGLDLSESNLDTETVGDWLLCMQAQWWTGNPSCLHPLGHTLEVSFMLFSWMAVGTWRLGAGWGGWRVVENHFQVAIGWSGAEDHTSLCNVFWGSWHGVSVLIRLMTPWIGSCWRDVKICTRIVLGQLV